MFIGQILCGNWDTGWLEIMGMPKDFVLSARKLVVMEEKEYHELVSDRCKWKNAYEEDDIRTNGLCEKVQRLTAELAEARKKPEPTELTTLARRFLPPVEVFEHVDITDVSEQPGQLELICHKLCKEIDRLTAELKTKDKALQNIIDESGKVDKSNWPRQQQLCQVIAQEVLKYGE